MGRRRRGRPLPRLPRLTTPLTTLLGLRLKRRKPSGRNQWVALGPLLNLASSLKRNLEGGWLNLEWSPKVQINLEGDWSNLEVQSLHQNTRVHKLWRSQESLQDPL